MSNVTTLQLFLASALLASFKQNTRNVTVASSFHTCEHFSHPEVKTKRLDLTEDWTHLRLDFSWDFQKHLQRISHSPTLGYASSVSSSDFESVHGRAHEHRLLAFRSVAGHEKNQTPRCFSTAKSGRLKRVSFTWAAFHAVSMRKYKPPSKSIYACIYTQTNK